MMQLKELRGQFQLILPNVLQKIINLNFKIKDKNCCSREVAVFFPHLKELPFLEATSLPEAVYKCRALKIGVVFSGGQAAGGHNVIAGLYDALIKLNPESRLFGFLDGPSGLIEGRSTEITALTLVPFRNQGGFDLLGSGRTKIETEEQMRAARKSLELLDLDGLVIVGGDDSNTNAAFLAEYLKQAESSIAVIGIPKTIDGDLKNRWIETSFGFDTATKTYSAAIGSVQKDALSAKKYYFFIKLMGRSASHIALECALQTQPNMTLIGEEIANSKETFQQLIGRICDLISARAAQKKNYGVFLIPEGVIEFIPEFKQLISELNRKGHSSALSTPSQKCFETLPKKIQEQLFLDRDPHGNIQVSKIETEQLILEAVGKELELRKKRGDYSGKFSGQALFFGYEGRSCLPSNFDCLYCYALGHVAALLIKHQASGYMACVNNLRAPVREWKVGGIPLTAMIHLEERKGKVKPVIQKALVDLQGDPFKIFSQKCKEWLIEDYYLDPGPMQFFGPTDLTDSITKTLELEGDENSVLI